MSTSKTSENIKDIGEVGFIGLGQMGSGIVENLLSKGVMVSVFDKNTHLVKKACPPQKNGGHLRLVSMGWGYQSI